MGSSSVKVSLAVIVSPHGYCSRLSALAPKVTDQFMVVSSFKPLTLISAMRRPPQNKKGALHTKLHVPFQKGTPPHHP